MAGTKHTKGQRLEIKSIVATQDRRGLSMTEIAEVLRERHGYSMSPQMVAGYRRQVWEEYNKRNKDNREAMMEEKREQYRMLRKLAWEAWDRSQENATKVVEESQAVVVPVGGDASGALESAERLRRIVTCEGRLPDNAYLKTILETLEAERQLFGLDEPRRKIEEPGTLVNVNVSQVNIESLTRSFKEQAMLEAKALVENARQQQQSQQLPIGLKELPNNGQQHTNGDEG